jgi:hypothetical protein
MKRIPLWIILLPALSLRLAAGSVSLKSGLSQAGMISGYGEKALTGFQFGPAYELSLSGHLALGAELAFVRRGTAEGMPQLNSAIRNRITLDCLELPVMLGWRPNRIGARFRPFLCLGGYAAYIFGVRSRFRGAGVSYDEKIADEVRRADLGLLAGIGCEFPLLGRAFIVEGRLHDGLARLDKPVYPQAWKTTSLSLLLGMKL